VGAGGAGGSLLVVLPFNPPLEGNNGNNSSALGFSSTGGGKGGGAFVLHNLVDQVAEELQDLLLPLLEALEELVMLEHIVPQKEMTEEMQAQVQMD
jgi:hypothetical protein